MIRPFKRFLPMYVDEFIRMDKVYLVAQTYDRHYDSMKEEGKKGILISDYDEPGLAKGHLQAVKNAKDKYASIINLKNKTHYKIFQDMLNINSPYAIYWAAVESRAVLERHVNHKLKDNMKRYIDANTNWHISRDDGIKPKVSVIFGELFVTLKYRKEELRIKLEVIEKS